VPLGHRVVVVQPPQVVGVPGADRLQPQAVGEPDAYRLGDDVPQTAIAVGAAPHHQLEVVRPDPGGRVVLAVLQPGRVEVAVHVDEVVELTADHTAILPLPVGDHGLDAPQPPAGLLLELAGQRLLRRLAGFEVTTHDVPDARQHPPVGRPALGVDPVPMVADEGSDTGWRTHAATVATRWSAGQTAGGQGYRGQLRGLDIPRRWPGA